MIDLHYTPTPNGQKITIFLEEAGLDCRLVQYDLFEGMHLTPEFRRINPNCKLPAIVDHEPLGQDEPLSVFESGAILVYLAEKSGQFLAANGKRRSLAQQWLAWQVGGLGPMLGQANYFVRYAPEGQDFAIERYMKESERLLNVLECRLREAEYLAEDYSIADMAVWPWVVGYGLIGIELTGYPAVRGWFDRISERPAVKRAVSTPELFIPDKYLQSRAVLTDEQRSTLFGKRMHEAARVGEI